MNNLDKIATHPLQTSAWADFRRKWGNEVLETKWGLITVHSLPFTDYKIGIFEKGPMPIETMVKDLIKIGKEKNLVFIKLEPNYPVRRDGMKCADKDKAISLLTKYGAVPGKTVFTPTTFWIDLTKSEEELMASFHQKTRYNIRLAQKRGVTVEEDNSDSAFKKYISLMAETVSRQGFYAHNKRYHELMWKSLKGNIAHLLVARYKGRIIAAWIVFAYKGFLYYPYGASSSNPNYYRLMPSALLMWEAIKFGKKLGLTTFDLWGREEGKGFTKFKEGYNPHVVEFLGTWDLVITTGSLQASLINKPLYYLYRLSEMVRWPSLKLMARFGLSKHRF